MAATFTLADAVVRLTASSDSLNRALGNAEKAVNQKMGNILKAVNRVGSGMKSVGDTVSRMGATVLKWSAVAGGAAIAAGAAFFKFGMDAVESENLFTESMGKMADAGRAWSVDLAKQLGLNEFAVRKYLGTFNVMLESMGLAPDAAFDMSKGLTQLSYDMASFFNLKPEEAFQKLQAGISGEAEPLKRLGILVNDTTVKAYALEKGIGTATGGVEQNRKAIEIANKEYQLNSNAIMNSTKSAERKKLELEKLAMAHEKTLQKLGAEKVSLTEADKIRARYLLIMERTSKAQGDLGRTMDSPTNMLRRMREQTEALVTKMAMALLPVLESLLGRVLPPLNTAIESLTTYIEQNKEAIVTQIQTAIEPWIQSMVKAAEWVRDNAGKIIEMIGAGMTFVREWGPVIVKTAAWGFALGKVASFGGDVVLMVAGLVKGIAFLNPMLTSVTGLAGKGGGGFFGWAGAVLAVASAGWALGRWIDTITANTWFGKWVDDQMDKLVQWIERIKDVLRWLGILAKKQDPLGDRTKELIASGQITPGAPGAKYDSPAQTTSDGTPVWTPENHPFTQMARGGTVSSAMQLVGERGPELVSLPRGSRVHPADETARMRAGAGSRSQTINLTIKPNSIRDVTRADLEWLARQTGEAFQMAGG